MKLRSLGSTTIKITPIGLGCWQFSKGQSPSGWYWSVLDQETINSIVKAALQNGLNWFDTAEAYGWGASEQALAEALHQAGVNPADAIIATKWMPALRFASSITQSIGTRLEKLGGYPISLYQIHNPMSFSSIENQLKAMGELIKEKKVKAVGVSNFDAERMRRADETLKKEGLLLTSNQMRFNLLDRKIEKDGVLDYAKENHITIIAYSPLAQGLLSGKFHEDPQLVRSRPGFRKYTPNFQSKKITQSQPLIDALKDLADKYKVTPAQVALNWTVNFHGDTIVAIPGASSVKQAEQNANAMKFELSVNELKRLDEISWAVIGA